MPLRMNDITEVRPAPPMPPDVQRQADRAQWVLYLLRRRVPVAGDVIFSYRHQGHDCKSAQAGVIGQRRMYIQCRC